MDQAQIEFSLRRIATGEEHSYKSDILVGDGIENGVRLTTGRRDATHALIALLDQSAWLYDLNSTDGTFVNDARIDKKIRLKSSDKLRFCLDEFIFKIWQTDVIPSAWFAPLANGTATPCVSGSEMIAERDRNRSHLPQARSTVRSDAPTLIFLKDGMPIHIELHNDKPGQKKVWLIGHDAECDVRVLQVIESVSRKHATITNHGSRWTIKDHLSTNGTFVNGRKTLRHHLQGGDVISFGALECIFHLPECAGTKISWYSRLFAKITGT